jgi:hypothetical protein
MNSIIKILLKFVYLAVNTPLFNKIVYINPHKIK